MEKNVKENKMKTINEKIFKTIDNSSLVVACSSGVDSMCLLDLVLKKIPHQQIVVAHVNHKRRLQSEEEALYLKNYCDTLGITIEITELDNNNDNNFQEWAREKRYAFFKEVAHKYQAKYILTAHHADDNLETILMRIMRSSSLKGYAGIEEKSDYLDYTLYRPFIFVPKKELIAYAKENKIKYYEDTSNNDDDYTRNRIRKYLVPFLIEENPQIYDAINHYAETINFVSAEIEKKVLLFIENKVMVNNNNRYNEKKILLNDFNQLESFYQTEVLFHILKKYHLSSACIQNLLMQINARKNNIVTTVAKNLTMIKEYGYIIFTEEPLDKDQIYLIAEEKTYSFNLSEKIIVTKNNCHFISDKKDICYNIDCWPVIIRSRVSGDKIKTPSGTKKVSDYLTDMKVPYLERRKILLLCDEHNNILNVLGYKK